MVKSAYELVVDLKEKFTLNIIYNLKQPPTYYYWTGTNEGIIRAAMQPLKISIILLNSKRRSIITTAGKKHDGILFTYALA